MEEAPNILSPAPTPSNDIAETLRLQRDRVREFFAAQTARLGRAQASLAAQSQRMAQWEQLQQETSEHFERLAEQIRQHQEELSRREEATLAQRNSQWEAAGTRQAELSAELETAHRSEAELNAQLDALRARHAALAAELAAVRTRQVECEAELELARAKASACGAEAARSADSDSQRDELAARLQEAEGRIAGLVQRLSQTEEERDHALNASSSDADQYRRRYELAMDDVHQLQARAETLEGQLRETRVAAAVPAGSGGGLDWEAEKRRILASLEGDSGNPIPEAAARGVEIQEILNTTEKVLGERDREIAELKQLLENQSGNIGAVTVGAAALGEMLDQDAIIGEQRESLARLQQEWEAKLRQAEIEISMERAKIARDRAQLEEQLRTLAEQEKPDASGKPEKPARGRWLSRLGLKESPEP